MAINEEIIGDGVSAVYNPSGGISDVIVEGSGQGQIFLECQVPSGKWISISNMVGAFNINTPDAAIGYRFRASNVLNSVRVYMGP